MTALLGTNINEIRMKAYSFSFKKMPLKCRPVFSCDSVRSKVLRPRRFLFAERSILITFSSVASVQPVMTISSKWWHFSVATTTSDPGSSYDTIMGETHVSIMLSYETYPISWQFRFRLWMFPSSSTGWHVSCQALYPLGLIISILAVIVLTVFQCCAKYRQTRFLLISFIPLQVIGGKWKN